MLDQEGMYRADRELTWSHLASTIQRTQSSLCSFIFKLGRCSFGQTGETRTKVHLRREGPAPEVGISVIPLCDAGVVLERRAVGQSSDWLRNHGRMLLPVQMCLYLA